MRQEGIERSFTSLAPMFPLSLSLPPSYLPTPSVLPVIPSLLPSSLPSYLLSSFQMVSTISAAAKCNEKSADQRRKHDIPATPAVPAPSLLMLCGLAPHPGIAWRDEGGVEIRNKFVPQPKRTIVLILERTPNRDRS